MSSSFGGRTSPGLEFENNQEEKHEMKIFNVTFKDRIFAETEEEAYAILLRYLEDVTEYGDVEAFGFSEEPAKEEESNENEQV